MIKKKLLVLVIITVALGGYFVFSKKSAAPAETSIQQVPQEVDASDWKTYRNEEFGFEAKYPNTWSVGLEGTDNITGKQFSVSLMKPREEGDKRDIIKL